MCSDTVYKHLQSDAAFAQGWQVALETGYRALEAELVRQQRAAQARYRVEVDADVIAARALHQPEAGPRPRAGEDHFERSMQLLIQWRKADGTIGKRASPRGDARQRWSFDEAIVLLEKKLAALARRSASSAPAQPLQHPSDGPPPRSGEELG